jgi:hypothetical protein
MRSSAARFDSSTRRREQSTQQEAPTAKLQGQLPKDRKDLLDMFGECVIHSAAIVRTHHADQMLMEFWNPEDTGCAQISALHCCAGALQVALPLLKQRRENTFDKLKASVEEQCSRRFQVTLCAHKDKGSVLCEDRMSVEMHGDTWSFLTQEKHLAQIMHLYGEVLDVRFVAVSRSAPGVCAIPQHAT